MKHDQIHTSAGILLDFDGPVCTLFAGLPAEDVAADLSQIITRHSQEFDRNGAQLDLGDNWRCDPLAVLRICNRFAPELIAQVEDVLQTAELAAVETARPAAGAEEFLTERAQYGQPVVIVSNNSEPAICAYLKQHHLTGLVTGVYGRPAGQPSLMKPHPYLLNQAARSLRQDPARLIMIGDSVTDIQAAHSANAVAIGVANKPHKKRQLRDAGAARVVDSLHELLN